VEHTQRLISLAALIGWTIFRLVRYLRASAARPQRPAQPPTAPATAQSPIEPEGRPGSALAGLLAAAAVLVAGNALIWAVLFAVPALEAVPTVWRLTAGVLANLILIRAASIAVARAGSRSPGSPGDDRNPIK
jgi:hypothetical protein